MGRQVADALPGSPPPPRLILAGAVALLVHVLAGLYFMLQDPTAIPDHTIQVRLAPQGATPLDPAPTQAHAAASRPTPVQQAEQHPEQNPEKAQSNPGATSEAVATTDSPQRIPEPEPAAPVPDESHETSSASATSEAAPAPEINPAPEAEPAQPQRIAENRPAPTPPATPQQSGTSAPPIDQPVDDVLYQQSSRPELPELDPYQLVLSRHMMQPIKQILRRGPILTRFNEAVEAGTQPITIELRLLANGAVRRVRLMQSSGSEVVDRVAVQSALAASPYPPPPEKDRLNGFRFRLNLVMSPVYL